MNKLMVPLRRLAALAQIAEPTESGIRAVCAELSGFEGGSVIIASAIGKVLALEPEAQAFRLSQSIDGGTYLDSRVSDRLNGLTELTTLRELADFQFKNTAKEDYKVAIQPLFAGAERTATVILYSDTALSPGAIELLLAVAAVTAMMLRFSQTLEATGRRRDNEAAKQAIGTLSYSELAAMVEVFRELGGGEGTLVAGRIADKLGITRSIVANALRKLEGAGTIETRSLGMKGTYIRVVNSILLTELYKIK